MEPDRPADRAGQAQPIPAERIGLRAPSRRPWRRSDRRARRGRARPPRRASPWVFQWARSASTASGERLMARRPCLVFGPLILKPFLFGRFERALDPAACRRRRRSPSTPSAHNSPRRIPVAERDHAEGVELPIALAQMLEHGGDLRFGRDLDLRRRARGAGGRPRPGFARIKPSMSARGRARGVTSDGMADGHRGERLSADAALAHERRIKLGQMDWLDALQLARRQGEARPD